MVLSFADVFVGQYSHFSLLLLLLLLLLRSLFNFDNVRRLNLNFLRKNGRIEKAQTDIL